MGAAYRAGSNNPHVYRCYLEIDEESLDREIEDFDKDNWAKDPVTTEQKTPVTTEQKTCDNWAKDPVTIGVKPWQLATWVSCPSGFYAQLSTGDYMLGRHVLKIEVLYYYVYRHYLRNCFLIFISSRRPTFLEVQWVRKVTPLFDTSVKRIFHEHPVRSRR